MDTTRGFVQKIVRFAVRCAGSLPAFAHAHGGTQLEEALLAPGPTGSGGDNGTRSTPRATLRPRHFRRITGRTLVVEVWYPRPSLHRGRDVPSRAAQRIAARRARTWLGSTRLEIRYAARFGDPRLPSPRRLPLSNRAAQAAHPRHSQSPGDVIFLGQNLRSGSAVRGGAHPTDGPQWLFDSGATRCSRVRTPVRYRVRVFAHSVLPVRPGCITSVARQANLRHGRTRRRVTLFDLNMVPRSKNMRLRAFSSKSPTARMPAFSTEAARWKDSASPRTP